MLILCTKQCVSWHARASPTVIQDLTHFLYQRYWAEGLLQEKYLIFQYSVPHNRIIRITRHEQNPGLGSHGLDDLRQFTSAHFRHHHVGDHNVDGKEWILAKLDGRFPIRRFSHRVSFFFEDQLRQCPQLFFIFNQQHTFSATFRFVHFSSAFFRSWVITHNR